MNAQSLATTPSIRLSDGRTLGYAETGDPSGRPVFLFHGTPGSRLMFLTPDPLVAELGVRLILPERPGYGLSSPQRGRTLLGWASDLRQLADRLGLERFAVAGGSGGGPYVAACAYAIPDRLTAASMFCSPAPLDEPAMRRGLSFGNRFKFLAPRYMSWLLWLDMELASAAFRRAPRWFTRRLAQMSPTDRQAFLQPEWQERTSRMLLEAFRQGSKGTLGDLMLIGRPWGFDLGRIRIPVHLWHGEEDRMAPVAMGRLLAERIPKCRARFLPGLGHLLMREPSVWRQLLEVSAGRCSCAAGASVCSVLQPAA